MRMAITGGVEPFDIDQMMELDMEVQHHDANQPVSALTTVADALPGLGIVAAVLGVVITMGALGGPPEEIGHKVAAALVGTFLGILLCYGLVGPVGANMGKTADEERAFLYVLRVLMLGFAKNLRPRSRWKWPPGRARHVRPSFAEVEAACRGNPPAQPQKGSGGITHAAAPHHRRSKKATAHGHHGGAWKVAYADFVTAMMALFIVLWLMNSSERRKAVAGYFNDPTENQLDRD